MKIEQIIALTQAGFTKNDILAMCGQNQQITVQSQQMPVQSQQMQVQTPPQQPYQQMPNGLYSGYTQVNDQNDVLSALKILHELYRVTM